jgi:hypothetical protein
MESERSKPLRMHVGIMFRWKTLIHNIRHEQHDVVIEWFGFGATIEAITELAVVMPRSPPHALCISHFA